MGTKFDWVPSSTPVGYDADSAAITGPADWQSVPTQKSLKSWPVTEACYHGATTSRATEPKYERLRPVVPGWEMRNTGVCSHETKVSKQQDPQRRRWATGHATETEPPAEDTVRRVHGRAPVHAWG
jgi:hypothetical protein